MIDLLTKIENREWMVIENKGQKIFAVLHTPCEVENPPIVMICHGFSSSKHGSNRSYVRIAEGLAAIGIATLRFDFRGSGDSEGSLSDISLEDLISDAFAVYQAIENREEFDNERIGIFGASLGGAVALLSNAIHKRAKSIALWAPVARGDLWYRDLVKRNPDLTGQDPLVAMAIYKGITIHPLFRQQFAAMSAEKTLMEFPLTPLLHMQGEKDMIISTDHTLAYKKYAGPNTQFITYPNAEHSLGFASAFPDVIQTSVDWFQKTL